MLQKEQAYDTRIAKKHVVAEFAVPNSVVWQILLLCNTLDWLSHI